MENEEILTLESDWLPSSELSRLVSEYRADFPDLSVSDDVDLEHRGLDPTIAVAIINGIFTTLVPFVTKLAERIFKQEPDAYVIIGESGDKDQVVLRATIPAKARDQLLKDALASRPLKVRISLEPPSG
jgi:hypothetical protein